MVATHVPSKQGNVLFALQQQNNLLKHHLKQKALAHQIYCIFFICMSTPHNNKNQPVAMKEV